MVHFQQQSRVEDLVPLYEIEAVQLFVEQPVVGRLVELVDEIGKNTTLRMVQFSYRHQ
jgi:hypothetical protein